MTNTISADSADWAAFRSRFYTVAAILAALLALLWLLGYGPGGSACKASVPMAAAPASPEAAPAAATPVPTPAPTPAAATATAAAAPAAVTTPGAVVYFEVGKADLPADADKTLADVLASLKANAAAKVQLSGFHDPSGNLAQNEELALNRARAVRAALEAAGIAHDRVVMAKPAVTAGSGDAREARRVEVTVL
jgi:outer membrane protein OmpA-like peptidoglycan-associated protein